MKKNKYWVQVIYAVIAPDGTYEDYLYSKKDAMELSKKLNKERPE